MAVSATAAAAGNRAATGREPVIVAPDAARAFTQTRLSVQLSRFGGTTTRSVYEVAIGSLGGVSSNQDSAGGLGWAAQSDQSGCLCEVDR